MREPMSVASHAGQRNTASMTSSDTTGIAATRQVSVRLLSGSSTWVNMSFPLVAIEVASGLAALCFLWLRLLLVDTTPARPALEGGNLARTGKGLNVARRRRLTRERRASAPPPHAAGEQHEEREPVDDAVPAAGRGRGVGRGRGARCVHGGISPERSGSPAAPNGRAGGESWRNVAAAI